MSYAASKPSIAFGERRGRQLRRLTVSQLKAKFHGWDQDCCFARPARPAISMTVPSQAYWPSYHQRESGPPRSTQRRSLDISRSSSSGAIRCKIWLHNGLNGKCLLNYGQIMKPATYKFKFGHLASKPASTIFRRQVADALANSPVIVGRGCAWGMSAARRSLRAGNVDTQVRLHILPPFGGNCKKKHISQ